MAEYRSITREPALVRRAVNLAKQVGCEKVCSLQTGRLLQLLASQIPSGVIGEIGSGCYVASAWIASALSPATSFFIVESDAAAAAASGALFAPLLNVRVVHSKWREFLDYWQFAMFYANPYSARADEPERFLHALCAGGLMVIDGLTPLPGVSRETGQQPDTLRDFWLNDERLIATEMMVSDKESVILATLMAESMSTN